MRKSTVLKDLENRPGGYVLDTGGEIICRAPLKKAALLALVHPDGTQTVFVLEGDGGEQRFSCAGKAICGCFVFSADELLLISDEAMRRFFEKQTMIRRAGAARRESAQKAADSAAKTETKTEETVQESTDGRKEAEKAHAFAQRRWPPPPCWDAARYLHGQWQEE